jgi:hypothetical protein
MKGNDKERIYVSGVELEMQVITTASAAKNVLGVK